VPRLYDHVLLSTWSHLLQPPCNLSMAIAWFTVVAPCLLPLPPQTGMLTRSCLLVTELLSSHRLSILSCQHVSEAWPMKAVATDRALRPLKVPFASPVHNHQ
jgi:hypothetical protein